MGTPHYIYSTAHEPHDAALDESLLDDMGPDEVEDDDTPAASEEDFDTEVWIHSVDNFASGYIGRVIHSLTDRFLIDKETKPPASFRTFRLRAEKPSTHVWLACATNGGESFPESSDSQSR